MTSYADTNESSPSLGGRGFRNCRHCQLSWAPGRSIGATSYEDPSDTSPSLEVASCAAVATFVGPWEVQRKDVLRGSKRHLAIPGGFQLAVHQTATAAYAESRVLLMWREGG